MGIFVGNRKFSAIVLVTAVNMLLTASLALGSSEESGGGGVTVMPDWTVVIQIINFLLILWILNRILYRPIRNILLQRKEKMDNLELSIQTYNEDAQEKDAAFAAGIKEARANGFKEKEALMQEATDEEKKIIAEINSKAQAELAEVRENIRKEAEVARQSLKKEVDNFANQIFLKILGRAV